MARALCRLAVGFDRLLRRLSNDGLAGALPPDRLGLPDIPFLPGLLAAGPLRAPYFWGRFDVFERADGELAILEYNCDKPTSQREIWAAAEAWRGRANPSRGARAAFRRTLARAWARHRRAGPSSARRGEGGTPPRVAILVDPSHREELHLAYLFGREVTRLGWPWDVVGPDNLTVVHGWASAYHRPLDIVIRQYPTDFLHELPAMGALWECTLAGRLLWLNDPRALLGQVKSSLAFLWQCAADGAWLTPAEQALVKRHLPPTGLASAPGWLDRAGARREDWVLKPALGRFSEGVSVGALCTAPAWEAALAEATARPAEWVVQAFVPPRRRWLPAAPAARGGYVNWGVYLAGGEPAGLLARLQPTALTSEATAWWSPLRVRPRTPARPVTVRTPAARPGAPLTPHTGKPWLGPGVGWDTIADHAALTGYTNVWTDGLANFTLAAVSLGEAQWDLVCVATREIGRAVERVLDHLVGRPDLVSVLGFPPAVAALAAASAGGASWSFLSRWDWGLTTDGEWKLLEINSDTPAGLWEAGTVAAAIGRLHPRTRTVGERFWPALAQSWSEWTARLIGEPAPGRAISIGLAGAVAVPEDLDQIHAHARAARQAMPHAMLEVGALSDVVVRGERPWLNGRPLDVLFRYHPLDWFADPALAPLTELACSGALPMLPPAHCLIPQSKAFLALMWELCGQGFFPAAEAAAIRAHVPEVVLDPARLRGRPHVVKPYLEREGQGVRFSSDLRPRERRRVAAADVVYQERVELTRARLPVATARGFRTEERTLVFGVFLAGSEVAGVYTRAGAAITGREAVFAPLVIAGG
jgi:glutathionylspermidine synthase